jgi:hypothetical protein
MCISLQILLQPFVEQAYSEQEKNVTCETQHTNQKIESFSRSTEDRKNLSSHLKKLHSNP